MTHLSLFDQALHKAIQLDDLQPFNKLVGNHKKEDNEEGDNGTFLGKMQQQYNNE